MRVAYDLSGNIWLELLDKFLDIDLREFRQRRSTDWSMLQKLESSLALIHLPSRTGEVSRSKQADDLTTCIDSFEIYSMETAKMLLNQINILVADSIKSQEFIGSKGTHHLDCYIAPKPSPKAVAYLLRELSNICDKSAVASLYRWRYE